jgi:hypothetical protein
MQGTPERLGDAEVGKRNSGQVTVILMRQDAEPGIGAVAWSVSKLPTRTGC